MAISMTVQLNLPRGPAHYYKATIYGMAATSDPAKVELAAKQLQYAFKANARFREWYLADAVFDATRLRIDAALDQLAKAAVRED